MEAVWCLKVSNQVDQEAILACASIVIAGWGRDQANMVDQDGGRQTLASTHSNTTIIWSQQISTGKFRGTVDDEGRVTRSKLIGQLKYKTLESSTTLPESETSPRSWQPCSVTHQG